MDNLIENYYTLVRQLNQIKNVIEEESKNTWELKKVGENQFVINNNYANINTLEQSLLLNGGRGFGTTYYTFNGENVILTQDYPFVVELSFFNRIWFEAIGDGDWWMHWKYSTSQLNKKYKISEKCLLCMANDLIALI